MKKFVIVLFVLALPFVATNSNAQFWKNAKKYIQQNSGLSEDDAARGIKEALEKGTNSGVEIVSKVDGYFGDPQIKIPFPPDAQVIESKLRAIGLGDKVDEVILTINRAAEDAAKEAKPIFVAAIRNMSIRDAINIVKGEEDAATQYLKKNTSVELNAKFQPVIKNSLDKVNATKHWEEVITTYNKIPFVKKMNPDLTAYVTQKAIDGLFVMIAKEEKKIREDPMARTTELLKKVFGN
jgi:hypothetical protein